MARARFREALHLKFDRRGRDVTRFCDSRSAEQVLRLDSDLEIPANIYIKRSSDHCLSVPKCIVSIRQIVLPREPNQTLGPELPDDIGLEDWVLRFLAEKTQPASDARP